MTTDIDVPMIKETLVLLAKISPDAKLLHLKNLCMNNGIWTIPENHRDYRPVWYEITLFDVPANARNPEDLPRNWERAARNILRGLSEEDAA